MLNCVYHIDGQIQVVEDDELSNILKLDGWFDHPAKATKAKLEKENGEQNESKSSGSTLSSQGIDENQRKTIEHKGKRGRSGSKVNEGNPKRDLRKLKEKSANDPAGENAK